MLPSSRRASCVYNTLFSLQTGQCRAELQGLLTAVGLTDFPISCGKCAIQMCRLVGQLWMMDDSSRLWGQSSIAPG